MDSRGVKLERRQAMCDTREGKKEGAKHKFWSVVKDKAKEFEMTVLAGGFQSVLKLFARTFKNFEYEVKEAFKREDTEKCNATLEQVRMINKSIMCENFKKNITTSQISKDGSMAFELLYDSALIDLSYNKVKEEQEEDTNEIFNSTSIIPKTTLDKHKQIQNDIRKEMAENHNETLKQTEQKFQEQISKLNEDIKSLREQKEKSDNLVLEFRSKISENETQIITEKELKRVYDQRFSALKLEYKQLQTQYDDLQLKYTQNDQQLKQKAGDLCNINRAITEAIYKGALCETKTFDSNSDLELRFNVAKHKTLISLFLDSKVKLPDIKRIHLDYIKSIHLENTNKFLGCCTPDNLALLCLNWNGLELLEGAKIMEGLTHSLPNVIKEIYLRSLEFRSSEVETIFQHSTQTQRLIFRYCKVHTKQNMNLGTEKTNITYLSFNCCGHRSPVCMEWDTHPERFEYIVEAISKSSLKDTLRTLNIKVCKISFAKVREMLTTHGLRNIKVVKEYNFP